MTDARPRRWAAAFVGGLVLVVAGGFVLHSEWLGRILARLVEDQLEKATGEHASVGMVRLRPMAGAVRVEGLVLSHSSPDPARDGATIAAAESITVGLGLRDGKPRIRRLELVRPLVQLHLDNGRLRELQGIPPAKGPPADELPFDDLYVRDGALKLVASYGDRALLQLGIEGLDAAPGSRADTLAIDAGVIEVELGEVKQAASAVHLPELEISPARIRAPEIALDFPDLDVTGSLLLEPAGEIAGLFTIETRLAAWKPLMPDRLSPQGAVSLDLEVSGRTQAPVLGGVLLAKGLELDVQRRVDPGGPPVRYRLGDLLAQWRVRERQLHLEPLQVRWADGEIEAYGAVDLATRGAWASITGTGLSLRKALSELDVAPTPWVDFDSDLEIQAAGTLQPLTLAGSWTLAAWKLRAANGPVPGTPPLLDVPRIHARGELRLEDEFIRLIARPVRTPRSIGQARARIGFDSKGPLDLDIDFQRLDLRDLAPLGDIDLAGIAEFSGKLFGPFDRLAVTGQTTIDGFQIWGLPFADTVSSPIRSDLRRLSFPEVHATRGTTPWQGAIELDFKDPVSLDLQLLVGEGKLSDVLGVFLEVPGLESGMLGTLELRGPVDALDGEARVELDEVDLFGEHFEGGEAHGWMDDGHFTLDELWVSRRQGSESIAVRGTVREQWKSRFDVRASALQLQDMDLLQPLKGQLQGVLTLDGVVEGTLFEPEPRGHLRLHDTRFSRRSLPPSALSFATTDGVLRFEGQLATLGGLVPLAEVDGQLPEAPDSGSRLEVAGSLGLWDAQPYDIQARISDFALDYLYPDAPDGSPVDARMTGLARVSGAFGDQPTPVRIEAAIDDTRLTWGRHRLRTTKPWTWMQSGEDYAFEGIEIEGQATRLSLSGMRQAGGQTRFAGDGVVDLDLLRLLVPGLERAEGLAQVELSARSATGRVRPFLAVQVDGATVRGDWFPATFESVSGRLSITPDELSIDQATGRLGGGLLRGSGRIALEGFRPRRYDLTGSVEDGRVRYFDWLPPVTGNARISFSGPADSPLLAGRIDVAEMLFTDRIDWESWVLEVNDEVLGSAVEEEGRDWFSMDLSMVADDTIQVRNNVADLTADAELRVIGDTARPGLTGRVRANPGGRVYLKEREFELLRGELRFVDPYTYDPELDFALTTEVRTPDQDYRIDAEVDGVWSAWRTSTRSSPSLAQADINALLLFGMTREEMERSGALTQALAIEGSDVLVSSVGIVERAEEGVFRIRGLEPLLDPLRPERLDLVSGTSERGSGEVSSELRLLYENDLADLGWKGGLLILEQNISGQQDTYIGLEQRLTRRLYLRTWYSTEQQERALELGGAVGLDVSFRWEFE